MEGTALEPPVIDRLSQTLVHVQPPLEEVSTPQHLRAWADAVIDEAADELAAEPRDDRPAPAMGGNADALWVCGGGAMGLREWEGALAHALARLQTSGSLSCAADTTTLGSASLPCCTEACCWGRHQVTPHPFALPWTWPCRRLNGTPRADHDREYNGRPPDWKHPPCWVKGS